MRGCTKELDFKTTLQNHGGFKKMNIKNWKVTYYKGNKVIESFIIEKRTEHEANKEAMADQPYDSDDYTLMEVVG